MTKYSLHFINQTFQKNWIMLNRILSCCSKCILKIYSNHQSFSRFTTTLFQNFVIYIWFWIGHAVWFAIHTRWSRINPIRVRDACMINYTQLVQNQNQISFCTQYYWKFFYEWLWGVRAFSKPIYTPPSLQFLLTWKVFVEW